MSTLGTWSLVVAIVALAAVLGVGSWAVVRALGRLREKLQSPDLGSFGPTDDGSQERSPAPVAPVAEAVPATPVTSDEPVDSSDGVDEAFRRLGLGDEPNAADIEGEDRASPPPREMLAAVTAERDRLRERLASVEAARDEADSDCAELTRRLREAEMSAQREAQLYHILKMLLQRRESPPSSPGREPRAVSAPAAPVALRNADDAGDGEPEPYADDEEHRIAARMARVMVADMFLYEPRAKAAGITEAELRKLFEPNLKAARETYEARASARVVQQRDHLGIAFDRAIRKRLARGSGATSAAAPGKSSPTESDEAAHLEAARVARTMVTELFLQHWEEVETGVRSGDLRTAVAPAYHRARKSFEEQVPEPIWRETHYLEMHFDQLLAECAVGSADDNVESLLRARLRDFDEAAVGS